MRDLFIQNTLTRKKEKFVPINPTKVGLYSCGPTVYNEPHLGNVRTFLSFDIVYRFLTHLGYKVKYVRNITDVGHITNSDGEDVDNIGAQAKKESIEPMEIVQKYTNSFHNLMRIFNVLPPDIEPTATGHIVEQIEMVQEIIDNGFGYEKNGSVYFDVPKFAEKFNYGKLSGRNIDDQQDGYRELEAQDEKQDPRDFSIWKSCNETHPQKYTSPWGKGVPGWHLECSVMSTKYLGETFDIHGGGMDLKFPHHDCEIAQSVGSGRKDPANYWMHTNMLTMNGKKMSKSLGNSILPHELISGENDLMDKGFSPMAIRFFMLQSHYSNELDLSNDALIAAEKGFKGLMNAITLLSKIEYKASTLNDAEDKEVQDLCNACWEKMCDDFNTPQTLAALFKIESKINAFFNKQTDIGSISETTFELMKKTYIEFLIDVLGLQPEAENNSEILDGLMSLIIDIRKSARENKDWTTSDKIRDDLNKLNVLIKDGKEGTTWSLG